MEDNSRPSKGMFVRAYAIDILNLVHNLLHSDFFTIVQEDRMVQRVGTCLGLVFNGLAEIQLKYQV